ncbi:MAG: NfeD family protein [Magnetospirillum sp.]|nr:NfeD family protein [Magnetospirillum sp.]
MVYWHWFILGAALVGLEVVVPGTFLLWPGIAALLTGVLAVLLPELGWQVHALAFTALSVAAMVIGRRVYARLLSPSGDAPLLNRRAERHVGQIHTLTTAIVDGAGRARIGDSTWKVLGPDLPAGAKVRVVGVEGTALKVEGV